MNDREIAFVLRIRNQATRGFTAIQRSFARTKIAAAQFEITLQKVSRTLLTIGPRMAAAGAAVNKFGRAFQNSARRARQAGAELTTALTLPIAGLATAAIKTSIDFESAMASVAKTVDGAAKVLPELENNFKTLAETIPVSVEGMAEIAAVGGQLGIGLPNIELFTETISRLGVSIDGISAENAAAELARIINVTGESQDTIDNLGSALVELGNNFAANEGEILQFSSFLSGLSPIAEVSGASILGIATALRASGARAQAGGTTFQQIFIRIRRAIEDGGAQLDQFARTSGQTAEQFAESFNTDAAGAVTNFIEGLGAAEREARGGLIRTLDDLGIKNDRVIRTLTQLAGSGDLLRRSLASANTEFETNTALTIESDRRFNTLAGKLQILSNKFKNVLDDLGDGLTPAFLKLIDIATKAVAIFKRGVDTFNSYSESTKETIVVVVALVAALGPLVFAFGIMGTLIGAAIAGFGTLLQLGGQLAIFIGRTLVGAFTLLFSPIGLIVAGILLVTNVILRLTGQPAGAIDTLKAAFDGVARVVKFVGLALARFAAQTVREFQLVFDIIKGGFKSVGQIVRAIVTGDFGGVITAIKDFGKGSGKTLTSSFAAGLAIDEEYDKQVNELFSPSNSASKTIIDGAKKLGSDFMSKFTFEIKNEGPRVKKVIDDVTGKALRPVIKKNGALAAKTFTSEFVTGFQGAFKEFVKESGDAAKAGAEFFNNTFGQAEEAVLDFVETGKFSIEDLARTFQREATRALFRGAINSLFGTPDKNGGTEGGIGANLGTIFGSQDKEGNKQPGLLQKGFSALGGLFGGGDDEAPVTRQDDPMVTSLNGVVGILENTEANNSARATETTGLFGSISSAFTNGLGSLQGSLSSAFASLTTLFAGGKGPGLGETITRAVVGGLGIAASGAAGSAVTGAKGGLSHELSPAGKFVGARFNAAAANKNRFQTGGLSDRIPALLAPGEAVVPLPNGREIPVDMRGAQGGSNFNITFALPEGTDANSFLKSSGQVATRLNRMTKRAEARAGG